MTKQKAPDMFQAAMLLAGLTVLAVFTLTALAMLCMILAA